MHFKAPENHQDNKNQLTLDENQVLNISIMSIIYLILGRNLPWSKKKISPSIKLFCVERDKNGSCRHVCARYFESNLPDGTETEQTFK